MPTLLSHPAVPLAFTLALGTRRMPAGMLLAGVVASMLPDTDGIAWLLGQGAKGGSMWGHRGYTHTLGFALLVGLAGPLFAPRWGVARSAAFAWMALMCLSHPLLDMLTSAYSAIALWWPFYPERISLPWHPVVVSPLCVARLMGPRGMMVLTSEIIWIWLPAMTVALLARALLRRPRLT